MFLKNTGITVETVQGGHLYEIEKKEEKKAIF